MGTALSFSIKFVNIGFANVAILALIEFRCPFAPVYGMSLYMNNRVQDILS